MREIKFRALYDHMGGGWKYGMLIYEGNVPRIQVDGTMTFSTCLKGTEGQFTGLHDKNNNPIYEGDIVERRYYHNNPPSKRPKVKFILAKLPVIFDGGAFGLDDSSIRSSDYGTTFNKWWGEGCEIIGNIYESPLIIK